MIYTEWFFKNQFQIIVIIGLVVISSSHPTAEEKKIEKRQFGGYGPYGPTNLDGSISDDYDDDDDEDQPFYAKPGTNSNVQTIPNYQAGPVKPGPTAGSAASTGATAVCQCSAVCAAAVRNAIASLNRSPAPNRFP